MRVSDGTTQFEVALLRARALLRVGWPRRAIDALAECAYTNLTVDEFVTGQMLLGSAYVRLGQVTRGAEILEQTQAQHQTSDVHPTIRAELTVNRGVAQFHLGRYGEAERLLSSVEPEADIIYARALEYRGWVAFRTGEFRRSAEEFRSAVRALDHCQNRDRFIEASVLQGLTSVYAELLEVDEWPSIEARIRILDWSANGMARPYFWTALCASMICEVSGDYAAARDWVRQGERVSDAPGYRVLAHCRTAAIIRAADEMQGRLEFIARAREAYEELSLRDLTEDLRQVPLFIAEEMVWSDLFDGAARLLRQYRDVVLPTSHETPTEQRATALENSIEAALLEASGDIAGAVRLYSAAFDGFDRAAFRRRACMCALRLIRLTGDRRYVDYMRTNLAAVPKYWLVGELAKLEKKSRLHLSPSQAVVLHLVAEGKTYKEIAALRNGSWKTARNVVHGLFRKFGVKSKGELVAAAMRQGVLRPSTRGGGSSTN